MVKSVDLTTRPFTVTPNYSEPVDALSLIVATGASAKWLGLENEIRLARNAGGVSACAVCDGALPAYRNKVLGVVGGGDTAMEEAMYLTKFASEVLIIHRRDSFRASKVMANRVLTHPKVRVLWNSEVIDVLSEHVESYGQQHENIRAVRVRDTVTGAEQEVPLGGLFIAIGHVPNTKFLGGQLELSPSGYIKVAPWRTCASVDGVFAAGDVIDDYYRQAITSAGTGCMAALEAERWLSHHGIGESPVLATAESSVAPAGEKPSMPLPETIVLGSMKETRDFEVLKRPHAT
jgi:thioredoxin reductase (NADPH)